MTRFLLTLAFTLGAATVVWVGASFLGTDPVAFTATLLIAAVYGLGFLELGHFRRETAQLRAQLERPPSDKDDLEHWLTQLPLSLRATVRRRVEGEPIAFPGPMLAPYLSGLLVMLGLLGTFIGMIVTLQGAVTALEGGNSLAAIQEALAAPIAGLSLAFGTSIAGVASSAMLGLAATLSRRERTLAGRTLDTLLRHQLRPFSWQYQQQEAFRAVHDQAKTLPAVVNGLDALTQHLEQLGTQLHNTLVDNQQRFHEQTGEHYRQLADSVGENLRASLTETHQAAAESVHSVISEALERFNEQTQKSHQRLTTLTEKQLQVTSERFEKANQTTAQSWRESIQQQQQTLSDLITDFGNTLRRHNHDFQQTAHGLLDGQRDGIEALLAHTSEQLQRLRDQETERGKAASQHLADLEFTVTRHLTDLGTGLEAPMKRMIEAASEPPKAAAEIIAQLREEGACSHQRDNQLLDERQSLITELDALLTDQRQTVDVQRQAIEALVENANGIFTDISDHFTNQTQAQTVRLDEAATEVVGGAHEVASLSDAFGTAVQQFSESNSQLLANLKRVETSMEQAALRSDEQLAYYVEQAREVIDLSLSAQKEVIEALGSLPLAADGTR